MDMDEWDRPTNEGRHPIAYAFEPVRVVGVLVPPTEPDYGGEIDEFEIRNLKMICFAMVSTVVTLA